MTQPAAEVKGKGLIGLLRYLAMPGIAQHLSAIAGVCPLVESYRNQRLRKMNWYPYDEYRQILAAIVQVAHGGKDEGFIQYGRWAAAMDLEFYKEMADYDHWAPDELIAMSDFTWRDNYRHAGQVEIVDNQTRQCHTLIHKFPEMDPGLCLSMEGWTDSFSRLVLKRYEIDTRLISCHHLSGGPGPVYETRWTPKAM